MTRPLSTSQSRAPAAREPAPAKTAPVATALLFGCDFSSAPSRRKPIVTALGRLAGQRVQLTALLRHDSLGEWAAWLSTPGQDWLGAFDLPFGLPRELVRTLGWPTDWAACMDHYAQLTRPAIRDLFAAFCDARPVGGKFAHRATDLPAGSSPSMKWVNPPVAWMLHAGVPLLRASGAQLVGIGHQNSKAAAPVAATLPLGQPGQPERIALEAYPGLLAREVLGRRSYKNDDRAKQTPDRLIARKDLLAALERGESAPGAALRSGLSLKASPLMHDRLADDASGDSLDATLCLLQGAWALVQHRAGSPCYGLPENVDPLEGWIVTA